MLEFSLFSFIAGAGGLSLILAAKQIVIGLRGDKRIKHTGLQIASLREKQGIALEEGRRNHREAYELTGKIATIKGGSSSTALEVAYDVNEVNRQFDMREYERMMTEHKTDTSHVDLVFNDAVRVLENKTTMSNANVMELKDTLKELKKTLKDYDQFSAKRATVISAKDKVAQRFADLRDSSNGVLDDVVNELLKTLEAQAEKIPTIPAQLDFDENIHSQIDEIFAPIKSLNKSMEKMEKSNFQTLKNFVENRTEGIARAHKVIDSAKELQKRYDKVYVNIVPTQIFDVEEALKEINPVLPLQAIEDGLGVFAGKITALEVEVRTLEETVESLDNYRRRAHAVSNRFRSTLRKETTTLERRAEKRQIDELLRVLTEIESAEFKSGNPIDELLAMMKPMIDIFDKLRLKTPSF